MVNRLKETWHVGQSVWVWLQTAKIWYPAVITGVGYKKVEVLLGHGTRQAAHNKISPENLCPRDPRLKGKDKPQKED